MLKTKLGVVTLAVLMFFAYTNVTIVSAEELENETNQMDQVKYEHKAIRPHFNFYYQLLAEKYAPKHVKVWNDVISEREALIKKYRELAKSGKEIGNFYDETWLKVHSDIQKQFLEAVEKRDDQALKNIVPQVIDHQKELNILLKKRLKEIK
ncbi:hypothetical protein DS745_15110 [Anaerobacillus alkaliphilus]|uniref:DUF4142 domain-containing protein n=1 Tax=Anaerobacillus alkaliphilus TaxID=1548597 RepID=A0A4Q0VSJ7_9BACI|nr:hypothetical protein [Anaerobacillus alkaliphilus]RXI99541.1 hypothetical protein DS745_15110 [Anaerobacillus alkaliphilus]